MLARVSVGKSYTDTMLLAFAAVAGLAPLLAVGGAAGGTVASRIVLTAVGGVFVALAVVRFLVVVRGRRWIKPTEFGFILTDRRGVVAFTDEMVHALGIWAEVVYSRGVAKANRRTGTLVLVSDEQLLNVPFRYDYPLNEPDPLGELFERVLGKLVAATNASLLAGGCLSGDGWVLDLTHLKYVGPKGDVAVPIPDIAAVEIIDAKVCVWRKGEAEPMVRIPAGSRNALVMWHVMPGLIPPSDPDTEPADGLGRIIFERDDAIRGVRLWGAFALVTVAVVAGVWMAVAGTLDQTWPLALIGLVLVIAAGVVATFLRDGRINTFRCHAHGVSRITRLGTAALWYGEIGSFTYSATRMYVDESYAGTQLFLFFEPLEGSDRLSLSYHATVHNTDNELERLREFVSRVIAGHMLRRLQAGQVVRWTRNMVFRPEGLELGQVGWFRGKGGESNIVPYHEVTAHDFSEGIFRLAVGGQKNWAVAEDFSQPNFFPGYALLLMILHPPEPAQTEAAPAAGE